MAVTDWKPIGKLKLIDRSLLPTSDDAEISGVWDMLLDVSKELVKQKEQILILALNAAGHSEFEDGILERVSYSIQDISGQEFERIEYFYLDKDTTREKFLCKIKTVMDKGGKIIFQAQLKET